MSFQLSLFHMGLCDFKQTWQFCEDSDMKQQKA